MKYAAGLLLVCLVGCRQYHPRPAPMTYAGGDIQPVTYDTSEARYPDDNGYARAKAFGAKGDGITDDTAAIQKAMDSLMRGQPININGGRYGTLYFDPGVYLISDTLWWATFGNNNAVITPTVDTAKGCITSLKIVNPGSGYGAANTSNISNPGPVLFFDGGGGFGPSIYTSRNAQGGVSGFYPGLGNIGNLSCLGKGYKSAPQIRALNWKAYLRFEGQSKRNTTIKLTDNNPRFANYNCKVSPYGDPELNEFCRPMLMVGNEGAANSYGVGESAYITDIWNLTIDTGRGNPGAVGIDWEDSNRASLKNLIVQSGDGKGRCGISVARSSSAGTGPGYVKNVVVDGFDFGIYANAAAHEVGTTFEFIDLMNIRRAGVVNGGMPNWFRQITQTKSSAPAFLNQGDGGALLVVDGSFDGGFTPPEPPNPCPCAPAVKATASPGAAIINKASHPVLYLRNINTVGYTAALEGVTGDYIDEYSVPQAMTDSRTSLNIQPVPNTPEHWRYPDTSPQDWVSTGKFGCNPNTGTPQADCIQKALDAATDMFSLVWGKYTLNKTIRVRDNVRVFYGNNSYLINNPAKSFCTISVEGTNPAPVEIRNINFDQRSQSNSICISGTRTVIVADTLGGINLTAQTTSGTLPLFFENVAIPVATLNVGPTQPVWMRQWDVESGTGQHTKTTGGVFWVFGHKTEGAGPLWDASNGTLEFLGSFSSSAGGPTSQPAYKWTNVKASAHGMTLKANGWRVGVQDDGQNTAPNSQWIGGGNGSGAVKSKKAQ